MGTPAAQCHRGADHLDEPPGETGFSISAATPKSRACAASSGVIEAE